MQQPLLIALLLTAILATTIQAAPATAVTVYVHNGQPVAGMPVTATSGEQVVTAMTNANGIAPLTIGAGAWTVSTCGQDVPVETLDEDQGSGGLLVIECHRSFMPVVLIKFDTQLMENPDIVGVEYQQGALAGYEIREYLLEKWGRKCAYCGKEADRLEVEHITPKSRGGSNRISNLCIACKPCNDKKSTQTAAEFGHPDVSMKAQRPMKDTAAVNATRWRVYGILKRIGIAIETGSGGRTKWNRTMQGYRKEHWIDAACVGESGASVKIFPGHKALLIKAIGRGSRQFVRVNKYGFPTAKAKARQKRSGGFATGDFVKLVRRNGEIHSGRISTGGVSPEMRTLSNPRLHIGKKDRVSVVQYNDGYAYGKLEYPVGSAVRS